MPSGKSFKPFLRLPSFYMDEILVTNDVFIDDIVFDKYTDEDLDSFLTDIDDIVFEDKEDGSGSDLEDSV